MLTALDVVGASECEGGLDAAKSFFFRGVRRSSRWMLM